MKSIKQIGTLGRTFSWEQWRASRFRMFALPAVLGLLLFGVNVVASQYPVVLTITSEEILQAHAERYFTDISGSEFILGLLIVQGPYIMMVLCAIIGGNVAGTLVTQHIESGRFEMLLNAPYERGRLFHGFVLGAVIITMIQTLVFGLIAIGSTALLLSMYGVSFDGSIGGYLYIALFSPLPVAVWATLIVITLRIHSGVGATVGEFEDLGDLVALAPPLAGLFVVSLNPGISVLWLTAGMCALALLAIVLSTATVRYWFHPVDLF